MGWYILQPISLHCNTKKNSSQVFTICAQSRQKGLKRNCGPMPLSIVCLLAKRQQHSKVVTRRKRRDSSQLLTESEFGQTPQFLDYSFPSTKQNHSHWPMLCGSVNTSVDCSYSIRICFITVCDFQDEQEHFRQRKGGGSCILVHFVPKYSGQGGFKQFNIRQALVVKRIINLPGG